MGIFVDYTLRAQCADSTLSRRLEAVRQRCLDLPLKSVGEVRRIEPVFNPLAIRLLQAEGHALPEAIAQRLKAVEDDPDHGLLCLTLAPPLGPDLPKRQLERYLAPALEFIKQQDLWKRDELPEKVAQKTPFGFSPFTFYRHGIELEFADIMLRYGYLLILHPGEGSESINLGLSTFRQPEGSPQSRRSSLWYGQGFTKTQYAKNFVQVHETVCRVLDIVQEEGLLYKGSDNCGYYASRSWKDASQRVNDELLFAQAMGSLMGVAVGNLREEGVPVQVLQDNASKAKPVDFSAALAREEEVETTASEDDLRSGS
jgi:hypothetical protein